MLNANIRIFGNVRFIEKVTGSVSNRVRLTLIAQNSGVSEDFSRGVGSHITLFLNFFAPLARIDDRIDARYSILKFR